MKVGLWCLPFVLHHCRLTFCLVHYPPPFPNRVLEDQSWSRWGAYWHRGLGQYWKELWAVSRTYLVDWCHYISYLLMVLHLAFRCPYYLSRELHKSVDVLFAPYNYLIDPGYRKSLKIDWENSILIFDEAHNLVYAYSSSLPFRLRWSCSFCYSNQVLEIQLVMIIVCYRENKPICVW